MAMNASHDPIERRVGCAAGCASAVDALATCGGGADADGGSAGGTW
jgi:hypothetical protein